MRLRAIAFDLDGTLADNLPLTFAAFRYACQPFVGRELSDAEIGARFGPSQEGIVRALAPNDERECLARFHEFFETRFSDYVKPISGINPLLVGAHRQGLRTAIVTGAGEHTVAVTLAALGLETSVERVLVGHAQGSRKQDQLAELVTQWHCRPQAVAYVGDSPSDMVAARETGVLALGAGWLATADRQALRAAEASAVFASPWALLDWLGQSSENAIGSRVGLR